MIAFVRGVIAASICADVDREVASSTSTKTGRAPVKRMLFALAMKVKGR